jgi:hypothetical protein
MLSPSSPLAIAAAITTTTTLLLFLFNKCKQQQQQQQPPLHSCWNRQLIDPTPTPNRQLQIGPQEQSYLICGASGRIYFRLQIQSKTISITNLQCVLKQIQYKHPLLRCVLGKRNGKWIFMNKLYK